MKPQPAGKLTEWLRRHEQEIVVDPIILGEIQFGILQLPKGKRRQQLDHWFGNVVTGIVCLSWESTTAIRWAQLLSDLRRAGQSMPIKDSMIAATALTHNLTVATRNVRDFKSAGVAVVNPFD